MYLLLLVTVFFRHHWKSSNKICKFLYTPGNWYAYLCSIIWKENVGRSNSFKKNTLLGV